MNMKRRTFLKVSGAMLVGLFPGVASRVAAASRSYEVSIVSETRSRCTMCSFGCGVIFRKDSRRLIHAEGDPDCPVSGGTLCARGVSLTAAGGALEDVHPLYRKPGSEKWETMSWDQGVERIVRRLKDFRDRELSFSGDSTHPNTFRGLGVITGGALTNEEAYLTSKLFRSLGVVNLDSTVRSSHGLAALGLLDAFGLPAATHASTQVAHSDVVVLVGCNPGQTAPALAKALDNVRRRSGTIIVLDPRRSESMKNSDIWLQLRPGTDTLIMGSFISYILEHGEVRADELLKNTDAAFVTLSEIMGQYQLQVKGKKKILVKDKTLSDPNSIYQRLVKHYNRYDLRRVSSLTGVDKGLLRRACSAITRTGKQEFTASFIFGSGAIASSTGSETVRAAAFAQTLLGNLKKRGGGIVLPVGAGNAQGVCDMGLLAPYLPGYLFPPVGRKLPSGENGSAMAALLRAWYGHDNFKKTAGYLSRDPDEKLPSLSRIIQGISTEKIRALMVIGSDPSLSLPGTTSTVEALSNLDLLVVLDVKPNRTASFWKTLKDSPYSLKTEVIFLPIEPPAMRSGSMTDGGRRVRRVRPCKNSRLNVPLIETISAMGNSLKEKYNAEGGSFPAPVNDLQWPFRATPKAVAEEINGIRTLPDGSETYLPPDRIWKGSDRCGNRFYRGQMNSEGWLAERSDPADPFGIGLFERWGWFWPWGIPDPLSWIHDREKDKTVLLRWKEQGGTDLTGKDVLPLRTYVPIRFWKIVKGGFPFPEHYEPFNSPLPDYLTGGEANPGLVAREAVDADWSYLNRRPEDIIREYSVIVSIHRSGSTMGTGGPLEKVAWLQELGQTRMLEIGTDFGNELGVSSGDIVKIFSPDSDLGISAAIIVTGRLDFFGYGNKEYPVTSLTLYGNEGGDVNDLIPSSFDDLTGGMELKAFMAKIEKI